MGLALPENPKANSPQAAGIVARGNHSLSVGFGLVSALVAFGIMHVAETEWLDPIAFYVGVANAAALGMFVAWVVQRLETSPRYERLRWAFVPLAGALVGMSVQVVLLRVPLSYSGVTVGLTKAEPVSWILAGAPLGAFPAIVLALLLRVSMRVNGRVPALDARERMLVPIAGVCLVLAAAAIRVASAVETPAVVGVMLLASATLAEIVARDRIRARWLRRAFAGGGEYAVVPLAELPWSAELPAVIGGAPQGDGADAVVVRVHTDAGYRSSVRTPIASTSGDPSSALQPLRYRLVLAGAFVGAAAILLGSALHIRG